MIVLFRSGASEREVCEVIARAEALQGRTTLHGSQGGFRFLRVEGEAGEETARVLGAHEAVERVLGRDQPFILSSREFHPSSTLVRVGRATFGGTAVVLAAGPCAVESRDQLRRAAEAVVEAGAPLLRGGAFKPRTSPYAFQGLGEEGLVLLRETADEFGLSVVTEVMAPEQVDLVARYADMLQIGSRSIQNFPLLDAAGRSRRPVLLKRGMMSTLDEFLAAADYILSRGNPDVVLCERGIRTFDRHLRNTFDVASIVLLRQLSHLPVIGDPSHATGRASVVPAAARAAVAAGADGILVEVHPEPSRALSDGAQALTPPAFQVLALELRAVAKAIGREL
jgi:3-deoxy-7-phosphoheptulonate synthase